MVDESIRLDNVCKTFTLGDQSQTVIDGVNLTVARGDLLGLSAPSGSGKTTLLNMIGCLDHPTSGTVAINDQQTGSMTDAALSRFRLHNIGYIFQMFHLLPVLSALENVAWPLMLMGEPRVSRRKRAREMLERVGLGDHLRKRPRQLSGGQRQRVAIARALVSDPGLVLADEPSANLDHKTACEIMALIVDLNRERGTTFFIATHDPLVIGQMHTRLTISDGKLTALNHA